MFFSPRIATKPLVGLCRRLSTSLEAGIDVRTALAREVDRAGGALHRNLRMVGQAIDQGESMAEALVPTHDYFPTLFREMVGVGEQTGHLDAVLARLAEHYQHQIDMRRGFITAIIWPMVQLIIAIAVVGGLIWLTDILRGLTNKKDLDLIGIGLVGNRGLVIYATAVGGLLTLFWVILRAMNRGLVWIRPIQRLALRLPILGKPLQTVALARLAWSMHLTMYAGMDLRQALKLSLRSTQNARYLDQIPSIDAEIMKGNSIYQAFRRTGVFPVEFLDTIAVGEDSGRLVESMAILARQYHDQARSALTILTMLAGWLVWAAVGVLLMAVVFRLFSFYIGVLNDASKM
jgi:type IV pilus assembly protein PilC